MSWISTMLTMRFVSFHGKNYVNDCGHFTSVTQGLAVEISDHRKATGCAVIAAVTKLRHYLYLSSRSSSEVSTDRQKQL